MKSSLAVLLSALVSMSVASTAMATQNANTMQISPPQTVGSVDIDRYLGKWYEIARKPTFFQIFCYRNVTAKYKLKDNGNLKVVNKCRGILNDKIKAVGEATVGDDTSKLTVNFIPKGLEWLAPPQTESNYWVLGLDNDYQHVMVGSPNRKFLWILARDKSIPEDVFQNYLNLAQNQGYDISNLRKTRQE